MLILMGGRVAGGSVSKEASDINRPANSFEFGIGGSFPSVPGLE
jgi:hypothetical protein